MVTDPKRISDGWFALEGGVDSGRVANLIDKNQVSFAINTTFRGGWPQCRPGFHKRTLTFPDTETEAAFRAALFQTAGGYLNDSGTGALISMHSGRQFKIDVGNFQVSDITIGTDINNPTLPIASWAQGQNFFVIEDGQSKAFIYNGATARRAVAKNHEIPVGDHITYYMGRFWVSKGREFVAGDIVFGPNGTPNLGYRDSILKFKENTYVETGGAFAVPTESGDITAMKPIASINTALGQGELIVFTKRNAFAVNVPQIREEWQLTKQLLMRVIQLTSGADSAASVTNVNEDLFYSSKGSAASLVYAVRNAGQWGNRPIGNEMLRIFSKDPDTFLQFRSSVEFDDRFLMTASPGVVPGRGVYHRCLTVLDFEPITSMRGSSQPAWDGIWTGLRFLRIVTVEHNNENRCFAYVLNGDDHIELWELTKDERFDHDGTDDVRIQWVIESRSMNFGNPFDQKELETSDIYFDRIAGEVTFDVDYRPDSHPCWIDWDDWDACAKYKMCEDEFGSCTTLLNYKEQYRPKRQLVKPSDTFDPILLEKYRRFYELQTRTTITGFCRMKQHRYDAYQTQERPFGRNL